MPTAHQKGRQKRKNSCSLLSHSLPSFSGSHHRSIELHPSSFWVPFVCSLPPPSCGTLFVPLLHTPMTLTHGSSPPEAVVTKPHRPQDVTSHDPSLPSSNAVEPMASTVSGTETPSSCSSIPLLASSTRCCRICRDDDPHGLYSPCRCRGSIKFVHSHCLTRW